MLNYILPLKMFQQQKGLVDPTEVPLPIGLSWVMKFKIDNKKHKKISMVMLEIKFRLDLKEFVCFYY